MTLSYLECFAIFFILAFGLAYWIFRAVIRGQLQGALVMHLSFGQRKLAAGEPVELTLTLRSKARLTIPHLKLEIMLPDGLVFADARGGDRHNHATLWVLRRGATATLRYRVMATSAAAGTEISADAVEVRAICHDPLGQGALSRILPPEIPLATGVLPSLWVTAASDPTKAPNGTVTTAPAAPAVSAAARKAAKIGKLIAYAGIAAILLPPLCLLYSWGARNYAPLVALACTPLLLALGYGVQALLLTRREREIMRAQADDTNDSYESGRLRIPTWRVILSAVSASLPAAGIGYGVGRLMLALTADDLTPANAEVGLPLLVIGCMLTAAAGSLLFPFKFQQILSLRTAVECLALLVFLLGVQMFWGDGIDLFFLLGAAVWALCLALCMNREAAIKTARQADGQYDGPLAPSDAEGEAVPASGERLIRVGTLEAAYLWLTALLLSFPLAALAMILKFAVLLLAIPPVCIWIALKKAQKAKEKRERQKP